MDKIRALAAELVEEVEKEGLTVADFTVPINALVKRRYLKPYEGLPTHDVPIDVITKAVALQKTVTDDFSKYFVAILQDAGDSYLNVAEKLVDAIRVTKAIRDDPQRKVSEDF